MAQACSCRPSKAGAWRSATCTATSSGIARHKDVVLLHYEEISERRFGGWTMGQVNLSKLNISTLLKYSEKPELDPYSVSGKVSLALLEELMATAAIVGRH